MSSLFICLSNFLAGAFSTQGTRVAKSLEDPTPVSERPMALGCMCGFRVVEAVQQRKALPIDHPLLH